MLPQRLRLRRSADFASVIKRGRKTARPTLVLYAVPSAEPHFGVVVGKKVGGAVERNLVKRRLRHGAYGLISESQPMDVVVRALPGAAQSHDLNTDLESAWRKAEGRQDTDVVGMTAGVRA